MNMPVLTQVSCDARTNSHICHPCPSEFYSLLIQHTDALRNERDSALDSHSLRSHRAGEGNSDLADLVQELGSGSLLEQQLSWSSCLNYPNLFPQLYPLITPHTEIYFSQFTMHPSFHLLQPPQVVNTCVNMNGSPAFWEVLGTSAAGKISLIKDDLNILITQNGSWGGYNQLTILNMGFLTILMSKLSELQHF